MLAFISFVIAIAATVVGHIQARAFTQERLRYVDAVHKFRVPLLAGLGATLLAAPIAWLLPFIGGGTAILFGVAVATGVSAGARDIRRKLGAG